MQYHNELKNDTRRRKASSTVEVNNQLYPLVKAGDPEAREQMIVGNMSLAIWLTDNYLRSWPQHRYLHSDLLSSSFVGLVEVVNNMSLCRSNPTGYISRAIRRHIVRAARESNLIYTPRRSERMPPEVVSQDLDRLQQPENSTIEVLDTIIASCETELDRQLVALRMQYHTFNEIGILLNIPRRTVIRWLHAIRDRFDAKMAS